MRHTHYDYSSLAWLAEKKMKLPYWKSDHTSTFLIPFKKSDAATKHEAFIENCLLVLLYQAEHYLKNFEKKDKYKYTYITH